jgi:chromosomal replication initiation ATPase DnaA
VEDGPKIPFFSGFSRSVNHAVFSFPAIPPGEPVAGATVPAAPPAPKAPLRLNRFYADAENPLLRRWLDDDFMTAPSTATWPLVLCGPAGVGKTTLAEVIVRRLPGSIVRTTAESFRRLFLDSCATRSLPGALKSIVQADGLFVDDFQLTDAPPSLLEAWVQVIDGLEAGARPLIVTMTVAPWSDASLPAAIRSRLSGGLVVPVQPPGPDARVAIIEQLAARLGLGLKTPDVAWLAGQTFPSVPAVSAFLSRAALLCGGNSDNGTPVRRISRQELAGVLEECRPRLDSNSFAALVRLVAKQHGVRATGITGPGRSRPCVRARSVTAWLARNCLSGSFSRIGHLLGNRDASTIRHEVETVERRRLEDPRLDVCLNGLQRRLLNLLATGGHSAGRTTRSDSRRTGNNGEDGGKPVDPLSIRVASGCRSNTGQRRAGRRTAG